MRELVQIEHQSRAKNQAMLDKHSRKTLENPVVFIGFAKKVINHNPGLDIDFESLDRTLEPDEAWKELKAKYPALSDGGPAYDEFREYMSHLADMGIKNRWLVDKIIADDKPWSEDELNQLSYVLEGRSAHSMAVDKALRAKQAKDARDYMKHPTRRDVPGHDTPVKKTAKPTAATGHGFVRVKEQEDGPVKYWFETKKGDVISLVSRGNDGKSGEIRVSTARGTPFAIPTDMYHSLEADKVLEVAVRALQTRRH